MIALWWQTLTLHSLYTLLFIGSGVVIFATTVFGARRYGSWIKGGVLLLLALLSWLLLWLLVVPLSVPVARGEVVFVTANTPANELGEIRAADDLFFTPSAAEQHDVSALSRAAGSSMAQVRSPAEISLYRERPARVRLLGDGLSAAEWASDTFSGELLLSPRMALSAPAIAKARWPDHLAVGERFSVAVDIYHETDYDAFLELADPQGDLLTGVELRNATTQTLTVDTLAPGRHLLRLRLRADGSDAAVVIADEPIAVVVIEQPPARLLFLQRAPSFEWRALSRWAQEVGAPLARRVMISDQRWRDYFSLLEPVELANFDVAMLDQFDLIIADAQALASLEPAKLQRVLETAAGAGPGLLIRVQSVEDANILPEQLAGLLAVSGDDDRRVRLPDLDQVVMSAPPLVFSQQTTQSLLNDREALPLVARAADTTARIGISLLRDSYRAVAVDRSIHAAYWSEITRKLARELPTSTPQIAPLRARQGERLQVCLSVASEFETLSFAQAGDVAFTAKLHTAPFRPAQKCSWVWPPAARWLDILSPAGERMGEVYIYAENDYEHTQRVANIEATTARAALSETTLATPSASAYSALPRWWAFVAFMLSVSALWWLEKVWSPRSTGPTATPKNNSR